MKKTIKKVFSVLCASLAAVALTACDKEKQPQDITDYDSYDYVNLNAKPSVTKAGSVHNYVALSYEERAEILALLEKYAMENAISGIVLYDNGGYVKYADRVVFGTNAKKDADGNTITVAGTPQYEYITGYGFGIMSEGSLNGTLSGEVQNPTYYHTYEAEDPKTLNYMNDKGSVVGSYNPYVAAGYFDTKLNADKDGYEWFPSTATEANVVDGNARPLPLDKEGKLIENPTAQTLTNKYRIYVRTGEDFKYATLTTKSNLSEFNGREVALEDYLTPYKELHNQSNGLARAAENLEGSSAIKGMPEYYAATQGGFNQEAWDKVGIKTGTDATGSYLEFEFVTPCTPFYAMYYTSSSLYTPIPAEFLNRIGGIKVWGSNNENNTLSPVDTTLSTGVFVVEEWNTDGEFVFKNNESLNPAIKGGEHRYTMPGLHVDILKAAATDNLAAWNEYVAGKLDSVGIPKDKIATEKATKGTQMTSGSSSTKLNVNTCTEEEWEKYFGENGTITKTQKSDYWQVEPAMSNEDFVLGLSWSIDRAEFAGNLGATPSIEYFTNNYLSDPEAGTSYNSTQYHKDAMEAIYGPRWAETYGYDLDKAIEHFSKAAKAWLEDGTYKEGDTIEIEIAWMYESSIKTSGQPIEQYLEKAFNNPAVCGNKLTLDIVNVSVAQWSDVYYQKMMIGQFDIAIGGISGNALNPLNFMEVLKSDNSSGFTLNWGPDTNADACIEYNGQMYTYDALWKAADTGALVTSEGKLATTHDAELLVNFGLNDGSRVVVIEYDCSNIEDVISVELVDVVCCWFDGPKYDEKSIMDIARIENGKIIVQLDKDFVEAYQGQVGFDLYFYVTVAGSETAVEYSSVEAEFPVIITG